MERRTPAQKALLTADILFSISSFFERQDDVLKCLFVHPTWTMSSTLWRVQTANLTLSSSSSSSFKVFVRKLWKSPVWYSAESAQLFIRSLRKRKSLFLYGHMVRRIVFKVYRSDKTDPGFTSTDLKLISRMCPNLKHLTFVTTKPPFTHVNVEQMLRKTPNLITLNVLNCDDEWLENALTPLRQGCCPLLRHLEVHDCSRSWSSDVLRDIGERCTNIVSLKLHQRVSSLKFARMITKSFPNLRSFECKYINDAGLQGLITGLQNLKSLSSQFENDVTDEVAESLAGRFAKLESLRIRAIHKQDYSLFSTAFAKHRPCLRQLYLAALHIRDNTLETIVKNCHHLESIEIFMCFYLTDASIKAITRYRNTKLKHLMIAYNSYITDESVEEIANYCTKLKSIIIISCTKLTDQPFVKIAKECKSLEEYTVRHHSWHTMASIAHTLSVRNKGTLKVLKMYEACVKDLMVKKQSYNIDAEALERLAMRCPNIKTLVLKCRLQEKDQSKLARALCKFKNLEELQVSPSKKLTSDDIKRLEKHRRLRYVTLIHGFTPENQTHFQQASRHESSTRMNITLINPVNVVAL
ncbi:9045_t:CDS:2 [Acaulospora morrowiae]|uniref:9045_t:CDS:1 n=1 Tax=Acaulospora morrowiae TaxID=94023 RepID=A0A9N9BU71_9GLOM|nr:9045_t:CDS:2 [Acaulospora morrowiae]